MLSHFGFVWFEKKLEREKTERKNVHRKKKWWQKDWIWWSFDMRESEKKEYFSWINNYAHVKWGAASRWRINLTFLLFFHFLTIVGEKEIDVGPATTIFLSFLPRSLLNQTIEKWKIHLVFLFPFSFLHHSPQPNKGFTM